MNKSATPKPPVFALVGNPNAGKTTLFNSLTGATGRVGNWGGVTVEAKSASLTYAHHSALLTDLPGVYSLAYSEEASIDEQITAKALLEPIDIIINMVDAAHLERNLYLTQQLLGLGIPMIVVLSRLDLASSQGQHINQAELSKALGCPVVGISSRDKRGLETLKHELFSCLESPVARAQEGPHLSPHIAQAVADLAVAWESATAINTARARFLALSALEDSLPLSEIPLQIHGMVRHWQSTIEKAHGEPTDILVARERYQYIEQLLPRLIEQRGQPSRWTAAHLTERLDSYLLNRWIGIPCFLMVMYALFFAAINIGGVFQPAFEHLAEFLFTDMPLTLFHQVGLNYNVLQWLMTSVGQGMVTVAGFIPVLGIMFLCLAFLEDSGYMSRAAFVVDRLMQAIGLPGKSFVPMIVGFGCNVPAIMGARTLENKRDRIMTVLMSPFMSCGARLAIFTVFIAAFFEEGGSLIVFTLYLLGVMVAILTGWLLKATLLKGQSAPLILEQPLYQRPKARNLLRQAGRRLYRFIINASKAIVPVCIIIGMLNSWQITTPSQVNEAPNTALSLMAKQVTPVFAPMGLNQENWQATVGLFTGVLAKEVVIGTLNALYAQEAAQSADFEPLTLSDVKALPSQLLDIISEETKGLFAAIGNPISASAPGDDMNAQVTAVMVHHFGSQSAAIAYLIFVLLYFPCVSATTAMLKEVNRGWTAFSVAWTTGLAYGLAVIYYQTTSYAAHPLSSSLWVISMLGLFGLFVAGLHRMSQQQPNLIPTRIQVNA